MLVCEITGVYFVVLKLHQTLLARLLDVMLGNKIDCFTDYDGDSKIKFESIFTIVRILERKLKNRRSKNRGGTVLDFASEWCVCSCLVDWSTPQTVPIREILRKIEK